MRAAIIANAANANHLAYSPAALFAYGQGMSQIDTPAAPTVAPPVAEKRPQSVQHHGRTLSDNYGWLRDGDYPEVKNPEIIAHLEAENTWFAAQMAPLQGAVDGIYAELKGRIKEADKSVPAKEGNYLYWREFAAGAQYRTWWRSALDGGDVQCILDEPALAADAEYFRLGALSVSPDGRYLAFATDRDGSERFTLYVRDLASGALLSEVIPDTLSSIAWSADSTMILYGLANAQWRTDRAMCHRLGDDPAKDVLLLKEADDGFRIDVSTTQSETHLLLVTGDHETSEIRLLPADNPLAEPLLVAARRTGVEYDVEEHGGQLFILTNDAHPNFRLVTASVDAPGDWQELIAGSDQKYLTGVTCFADFYVVDGREDGLDYIEIRYYDDPSRIERIGFAEASYDVALGENPEYRTGVLRIGYESMVTPGSVFDYDVATRQLCLRKVQEVPSGYDASLYATERLMLPARDGTLVPVSLVWRRDRRDTAGGNPLHLYGYGAYGIAIPPGFSTNRLSMLDRGYVYAIAHIRGGDDLGRHWYLSGKREARMHTFHDFIDVAEGLVAAGWTGVGRISISGGSAGGELVGAVLNMAPGLFGAAVAHVPFVDVLNTMLDASLPLTPGEWGEWGNPVEDVAAYDLIASYSPYDNVEQRDYPPIMVTAGLNDPRVTYWEPAKWVARLRATKTGDSALILKTNMGAGHGGKSGRFDSLTEDAEEMAFLFHHMGV